MASLQSILRAAKRQGLGGVAITDHNVILEELPERETGGVRLIWGEEVLTTEGEIIGLFLSRPILPGRSPGETIAAIREQGGITYLPHPFKTTGNPWGEKTLMSILPEIDVIEVLNGRLLDHGANRAAARLAGEAGILAGAGSDAHTAWEVGRAYVEMPDFDGPASFLASLQRGRVMGQPPSRLWRLLMNRFTRKGLRQIALGWQKWHQAP